MTFIVTNGAEGQLHDTVIDPNNGQLIDNTDNLTSTASAAGMVITELGLAMSGEFSLFKNRVALGMTPKFVGVETYDVLSSTNEKPEENEQTIQWNFNLDVGAAHRFAEQWMVGLTVKNIIPQKYTTSLNNELRIDPQVRVGLAYSPSWGTVAVDADVLENDAVGTGSPTQYLALGGEWAFSWGAVRGGYSYNFADSTRKI